MEDPQIIALYLSRDEEAVAQTVQKYTVYCRAVAQHILQSPEDAEEALNDTWLAAWNSIPPHEPSCLQTFLGRLTRNISLNKLRAAKTKKRGDDRAGMDSRGRLRGADPAPGSRDSVYGQ